MDQSSNTWGTMSSRGSSPADMAMSMTSSQGDERMQESLYGVSGVHGIPYMPPGTNANQELHVYNGNEPVVDNASLLLERVGLLPGHNRSAFLTMPGLRNSTALSTHIQMERLMQETCRGSRQLPADSGTQTQRLGSDAYALRQFYAAYALQEENNMLKNKLDQLTVALTERESELCAAHQEHAMVMQERTGVLRDMKKQDEDIERATREIKNLQGERDKLMQQLDKLKEQYKSETERLHKERDHALVDYHSTLATLDKTRSRESVASLHSEYSDVASKGSKEKEDPGEAERAEELRKTLKDAEKELSSTRAALRQSELTARSLEQQRDSIRLLCDQMRQERREADTKLADHLREVQILRGAAEQLAQLRETYESLMKQHQSCKQQPTSSAPPQMHAVQVEVTLSNLPTVDLRNHDPTTGLVVHRLLDTNGAGSKLRFGDEILSVNQSSLIGLSTEAARDKVQMAATQGSAVLQVSRPCTSGAFQETQLHFEGESLIEHINLDVEYLISGVKGISKDALLIGDRIVAVNGISVSGKPKSDVQLLLSDCNELVVWRFTGSMGVRDMSEEGDIDPRMTMSMPGGLLSHVQQADSARSQPVTPTAELGHVRSPRARVAHNWDKRISAPLPPESLLLGQDEAAAIGELDSILLQYTPPSGVSPSSHGAHTSRRHRERTNHHGQQPRYSQYVLHPPGPAAETSQGLRSHKYATVHGVDMGLIHAVFNEDRRHYVQPDFPLPPPPETYYLPQHDHAEPPSVMTNSAPPDSFGELPTSSLMGHYRKMGHTTGTRGVYRPPIPGVYRTQAGISSPVALRSDVTLRSRNYAPMEDSHRASHPAPPLPSKSTSSAPPVLPPRASTSSTSSSEGRRRPKSAAYPFSVAVSSSPRKRDRATSPARDDFAERGMIEQYMRSIEATPPYPVPNQSTSSNGKERSSGLPDVATAHTPNIGEQKWSHKGTLDNPSAVQPRRRNGGKPVDSRTRYLSSEADGLPSSTGSSSASMMSGHSSPLSGEKELHDSTLRSGPHRVPKVGKRRIVRLEPGWGRGPGLDLHPNQYGDVFVRRVEADSPASRAGLVEGDQVLEMDNQSLSRLSHEEVLEILYSHGQGQPPYLMMRVQFNPHKLRAKGSSESDSCEDIWGEQGSTTQHRPPPNANSGSESVPIAAPPSLPPQAQHPRIGSAATDGSDTPTNSPRTSFIRRPGGSGRRGSGRTKSAVSSALTPTTINEVMTNQKVRQSSTDRQPSTTDSEPRWVKIQRTGQETLGVTLMGGNKVGIFVKEMSPDSPVGGPSGLHPGDHILEYNGLNFREMVGEVAVREIKKPASDISVLVKHDPQKMAAALSSQIGHDHFYVRALFNFNKASNCLIAEDLAGSCGSATSLAEGIRFDPDIHLAFDRFDLLLVDGTLLPTAVDKSGEGTQPGLHWHAWLVDKNGRKIKFGLIPSRQRLERLGLLKLLVPTGGPTAARGSWGSARGDSLTKRFLRRFAGRSVSGSSEAQMIASSQLLADCMYGYARLQPLTVTSPRPVLLVGPLATGLGSKLCHRWPERLALPGVTSWRGSNSPARRQMASLVMGDFLEVYRRDDHFEGVTVQALKDVIALNRHCVLNVSPAIVDRLHQAKIYPIVILIRYKSAKQIKEVREPEFYPGKISKKQSREMFTHTQALEQEHGAVITAIIQGGKFDFMCEQVVSVVEKEQGSCVWVTSDNFN